MRSQLVRPATVRGSTRGSRFGRALTARVGAVVIAVVIVSTAAAGCSTSETGSPQPAAGSLAPSAGGSAPPTDAPKTDVPVTRAPSPAATGPIDYGRSRYVVGQEDCELDAMAVDLTWNTAPDGTMKGRGGEFVCAVTANDPRVAGRAHFTLKMDRWGASEAHGAQVQWGTIRIENSDGAWDGAYAGVYTSATGDVFDVLFTGSGAYAGLSYYRWSFETRGSSWETKGLIFPERAPEPVETPIPWPSSAAPSPATSTPTSDPVDYGLSRYVLGNDACDLDTFAVDLTWSTAADGTTTARGGVFVCNVTANDPRVAGTAIYTLNMDRWGYSEAHGAQVQWGSIRIENAGGAWETRYVGAYTSATGDVGGAMFTGSGGYAGLSYYRWSESYGASWPTKGLIFPSRSDP